MPPRPSETLVRLLRDMAQKKGLNTASLARQAGVERSRLKHLLAGTEVLTVDDFVAIAQALEISPHDMGLPLPEGAEEAEPDEPEPESEHEGPALRAVGRRERASQAFVPDPYGNHAEQALRLGFALGCDMFFITDVKLLQESGVPRAVLARYPEHLPIRLDAAYHRHNDPQYLPEGLQINLSFDALYTCTFPWAAFRQITFFPLPPSSTPEEEPPETEEPKPAARRGHLRLVE